MGHDAGKTADRLHPLSPTQGCLEQGALGDVDHLGDHADGFPQLVPAKGGVHLDEQLGSVGARRSHPAARDHVTGHRSSDHVRRRGGVIRVQQPEPDRSPDDLARRRTKKDLGRAVPGYLAVPSPSTVIVATGEDDTRVARRRVVSPRSCSAWARAAICLPAASSASIHRSPDRQTSPRANAARKAKPTTARPGWLMGFGWSPRANRATEMVETTPVSMYTALVAAPWRYGWTIAIPMSGMTIANDTDRVQRCRQDRLGPEQHDRQGKEQPVTALVDRDQAEDRCGDEGRLERNGQDGFAWWG